MMLYDMIRYVILCCRMMIHELMRNNVYVMMCGLMDSSMISHSCVDDCCSCVFDSSLMMRRSISQYSIGCIVFYNIQYSTVQYSIVHSSIPYIMVTAVP